MTGPLIEITDLRKVYGDNVAIHIDVVSAADEAGGGLPPQDDVPPPGDDDVPF